MLGFPQPCPQSKPLPLDLRHVLGCPRPRHGDRKVSMVEAHQNRGRRRGELGGRGVASSDAIGFDSMTYSEAGQEPFIATIDDGVGDLVAAFIGGGVMDLVVTPIGRSGMTLQSPRSVLSSSFLTSIRSAPASSTQQTRWLRQASSGAIVCYNYSHSSGDNVSL
jgi:hypothetical protein